ncbi:MAG: hypothetical protein OEZ06_17530 [Myxococcales bacterium]|nr:hypothetical protein [Myxococcales bacterium]
MSIRNLGAALLHTGLAVGLSIGVTLHWQSSAAAGAASGRLVLGAYKPTQPKPKRVPYNWELENGFKQVLPDRVDASRELAVVLVGEGEAIAGDRLDARFEGGGLLPSTLVVRTGTTVSFTNHDEIAHELYAEGLDGFSAEATSPRGQRSVNLKNAGNWPLADRLIGHLEGHLHVLPDLVAVATVGENGAFTFAATPAGTYTLKVFHGAQEISSQEVTLTESALEIPPIALTAKAQDPSPETK